MINKFKVGIISIFIADRIYSNANKRIFELKKRGYVGEDLTKQFKKEFKGL